MLRRTQQLFILALCTSLVATAHAQGTSTEAHGTTRAADTTASQTEDANVERARILFQRGLQLAERRDFSAAAKRFSEALSLRYAPAVEYNLASALYETGLPAEAYNRTQNVLRHPDTKPEVRALAERLERALLPQVARLTVLTSGEIADVSVRVDGQLLEPMRLGSPQAVTAGTHEVVALRGQTIISRRDVEIPINAAAIVELNLLLAQQPTPAGAQSSSTEEGALLSGANVPHADGERGSKRKLRIWMTALAGAVVVGAGITAAVLLANRDHAPREAPVPGNTGGGVLTW